MSDVGFILFISALMAILSVSLDIFLPVLPAIAEDFVLDDPTASRAVLTIFLFGFGIGHLALAATIDSFGRRTVLFATLALYVAATVFCAFSQSFPALLAGRVVQGFAAAGPRIIAVAAARDLRSGPELARTLSLAMMIFMAGPIVAPLIGQFFGVVSGWRGVTGFLAAAACGMAFWTWRGLAETWPADRRKPVNWSRSVNNLRRFFGNRRSVGNTVIAGLLYGGMFGIIGVSPQIYGELYGIDPYFPLMFALIGVSVALASLINARLVVRVGTAGMLKLASASLVVLSIVFAFLAADGHPHFAIFQGMLLAFMFCKGLAFSNCNALAIEPHGDIAGFASAMIGAGTMILGAGVAQYIGRFYDSSLAGFSVAYAFICVISAVLVWVVNRRSAAFSPAA